MKLHVKLEVGRYMVNLKSNSFQCTSRYYLTRDFRNSFKIVHQCLRPIFIYPNEQVGRIIDLIIVQFKDLLFCLLFYV
jgi:hypothetical protein